MKEYKLIADGTGGTRLNDLAKDGWTVKSANSELTVYLLERERREPTAGSLCAACGQIYPEPGSLVPGNPRSEFCAACGLPIPPLSQPARKIVLKCSACGNGHCECNTEACQVCGERMYPSLLGPPFVCTDCRAKNPASRPSPSPPLSPQGGKK